MNSILGVKQDILLEDNTMGIRENVKVLDSVKILDGFKSVLE